MTPKEFDLSGRCAIVTGASTGLGAAAAELLCRRGADVVIVSRNQQKLEDRAAAIRAAANGRCVAIAANVRDEEQIDRLIQQTRDQFGRIDILVNNAGGSSGMTALAKLAPAAWEKTFGVNVTSAMLCSRAVIPHMIAQRSGAIVNLSSYAGVNGTKGHASYSAAKAAIQMYTRVAAAEWGRHGVRVNCVAPGMIATEKAIGNYGEDALQKIAAANFPLGRVGRPNDIAQAIAFLVSDAASYISGETLTVAGGPQINGLEET
jgi:3-oxoacyl-[acyl-carrier protein] reductase